MSKNYQSIYVFAFLVFLLKFGVCGGQERELRISVVDSHHKTPLASRIYLTNQDGKHFYVEAANAIGGAVRYEKQNRNNPNATEYHTTLSATSGRVRLLPGKYRLTVERGKVYHPFSQLIEIDAQDIDVVVPLVRWFHPESNGWYSGDTHIHRTLEELRHVVLAEDLNVAMPLTYWVTRSHTPPSRGNNNLQGEIPTDLITVDSRHVIWPRNTEYEIFSIGEKRHTLGALFVLGHRDPLSLGVPTWKPVIESTRTSDVLYDMDKLDWPFAMLLPTLAPHALYELANNHMWRAEFGFENWNTTAPPFLLPPFGTKVGGERAWIDYTHGMYYSLLNCGLRLPPSAGTANGVHPVPAGFGRVYVHLDGAFSYAAWLEGLRKGRSFVTTGPMLIATADSKDSGHEFRVTLEPEGLRDIPIQIETNSQQPILYGELIVNGQPQKLLRFSNQVTQTSSYQSTLQTSASISRSGWFAIRVWEEHRDGNKIRTRFAHTAPWYVVVNDQPVAISRDEKEYLKQRMRDEMERSGEVLDGASMEEYQKAFAYYSELPVVDEYQINRESARPLISDRDSWLDNMIIHHRFDAFEVQRATGLSDVEVQREVDNRKSKIDSSIDHANELTGIRLLPYPGGRHPRRGFLDGAIDPQRETKVSVFPPWSGGGYVVVDAPEAIFSNLGLMYLAHKHVKTIWDQQNVTLPKLEWTRSGNSLRTERMLPNNIAFGSHFENKSDWVRMELWLKNGTASKLTGLRTQVCVMLKGLPEFNDQNSGIIHRDGPFIAIRHNRLPRWVITAWKPLNRTWNNPPVPCIHSDPIFPDCEPGETVQVRGGMWFYEGDDLEKHLQRIAVQLD